jgi:translation initiation factor IF-2
MKISNGLETKIQNLIQRPPVVVVLGHVDHGKTSILDFIRKTQVAEKEAGGITQHIGAYQIIRAEKKITFIDTPGHEAFSAMRARGAKVADIALLIVDTTQGVQAQTREAIYQLKLAQIPVIVVLNKIDRPGAEPEKVKRELAKENILVESLAGKIPSVEVSAKTGRGIDELLELILLVADLEELKCDLRKDAEGVVIESYLDSKRGTTATLILENGILKKGQILGTSSSFGRIKSLENFQGAPIETANPSEPVIVIGFEDVPRVGENFKVFSSPETAKSQIQVRKERPIPQVLEVGPEKRVLNLILKADVFGSLEAIEEVLKKIPQEKIILRILKAGVGNINESDVKFAKAGRAIILGFRVKIDLVAEKLLQKEKIRVFQFEVIYEMVEEVRKLIEKMTKLEEVKIELGKVKILATFLTEKNRQIIGGRIIEGEAKKGAKVEVLRKEELIGRGKLVNLQRNKKDTERVGKGEECGILFEGDIKIEEGDILNIIKA